MGKGLGGTDWSEIWIRVPKHSVTDGRHNHRGGSTLDVSGPPPIVVNHFVGVEYPHVGACAVCYKRTKSV